MRAYCFTTGRIFFGQKTPKGALPIASGPANHVREVVQRIAQVGRDQDARDGASYFVPGIAEAENDITRLTAFETFTGRLAKLCEPSVRVFIRAHRWPIAGRGSQR